MLKPGQGFIVRSSNGWWSKFICVHDFVEPLYRRRVSVVAKTVRMIYTRITSKRLCPGINPAVILPKGFNLVESKRFLVPV
jgi:hypothetical protein